MQKLVAKANRWRRLQYCFWLTIAGAAGWWVRVFFRHYRPTTSYTTPGIAGLSSSGPALTHGLFDLSGNVWEWVEDAWPAIAQERILRGGSWTEYESERIRASFREHRASGTLADDIGFRCVMERVAS